MNAHMFLRVVASVFVVLLCASGLMAQTGTLTAVPNPCTIAPDKNSCAVTVSWNVSGGTTARVTVQDGGGAETTFGTGLINSGVLTALAPPHKYTLRLYDGAGRWLDETLVLAMGTGSIAANPDPCPLASGANQCQTTVTWNTANVARPVVTQEDTQQPGEIDISPPALSGITVFLQPAPHVYIFRLYDASSPYRLLITETEVRTVSHGGISADPNPCPLLTGADACETTVNWTTDSARAVKITVKDAATGQEVDTHWTALSGSEKYPIQRPEPGASHRYTFYLYDLSNVPAQWVDEVEVLATGHGVLSATPDPCQIPSGSTTCDVYISWSTDQVASAAVTVKDVGASEEALFASGTSGKMAQLSQNAEFTLYDVSSGELVFLDAYEVTVSGTGWITADPNPCVIASGSTICTTTLDWSTNASKAEVWVQDAGGEETFFSSGASASATADLQGPPHSYVFYLYDVTSNNRVWLDEVSVHAVAAPDQPPTNLVAVAGSSGAGKKMKVFVNLQWVDNSSNESSFLIERCAGIGCSSFTRIASVGANATTYRDTSVSRRKAYTYRVRAHNAYGNSAYTNTATATTP